MSFDFVLNALASDHFVTRLSNAVMAVNNYGVRTTGAPLPIARACAALPLFTAIST